MKVQVQVTLCSKTSDASQPPLSLVVGNSETVASLKERVAEAQLIPFPEQHLEFEGKVLDNEERLSAFGIEDGSALVLTVKATDATLVQQFSELLEARNLSADELGLLYCYKHGSNISQALKCLAFEGNLEEFIATQKTLSMSNGSVAVVREDTSLKPFSVVDEISKILKTADGTMDIKVLSHKFADKFGVSLSSLLGCRPAEFFSKNSEFVVHAASGNLKRVSLRSARKKQVDSPPRSVSPETAPSGLEAPPGLGSDVPPGLASDGPPGLDGEGGSTSDSDSSTHSIDLQQYVELHESIYSKSFNSKGLKSLNDLVAAISEMSFMDIDHVVTGGSMGKGTAITGGSHAEIVLFVRGLPGQGHESWLSSLLKAVGAILISQVDDLGIGDVQVLDDSVQIQMKSPSTVTATLFISPAFDSYAETLQVLWQQEKDDLKFYSPALAKERTQFISRQPTAVKTTIRLMKWWRDQQQWSSPITRPSDEILELATVYSAVQTKPADQKIAIANVMSLLSSFNKLRVVWSNFYTKDDIPGHMLRKRPLLMDPTNPFVNVADSKTFQASELMQLASNTHFFW